MLKGQNRLLLVLAFLGDLFEEMSDPVGIAAFSYKQVYGFIPSKYKRHNFYAAVRRARRVGNIEKIMKSDGPYFRLTSQGKEKILGEFALLKFWKQKWDKKWRLVFFDIEEKNRGQRDLLRAKLYELGFGQLQESVYLSPFPIEKEMEEFLAARGLSQKVFLLVSQELRAGNVKDLAAQVWGLTRVNQAYSNLLEELSLPEKTPEEKKNIRAKFLEILARDPCLPSELLPSDWVREAVWEKIARF